MKPANQLTSLPAEVGYERQRSTLETPVMTLAALQWPGHLEAHSRGVFDTEGAAPCTSMILDPNTTIDMDTFNALIIEQQGNDNFQGLRAPSLYDAVVHHGDSSCSSPPLPVANARAISHDHGFYHDKSEAADLNEFLCDMEMYLPNTATGPELAEDQAFMDTFFESFDQAPVPPVESSSPIEERTCWSEIAVPLQRQDTVPYVVDISAYVLEALPEPSTSQIPKDQLGKVTDESRYRMRRNKNNEACRISRLNKKKKLLAMDDELMALEHQNKQLIMEVSSKQSLVAELKQQLLLALTK